MINKHKQIKKKLIFLLIILSCTVSQINGQKPDKSIVKEGNISQNNNCLNTTPPEDLNKNVLKQNPIRLKNDIYLNEEDEFKKLMVESSPNHKQKTVNLLNTLFNEDPGEAKAVLLIRNRSKCNIVMRVDGIVEKYNLPIPAVGENFIVIDKGDYFLKSNVCGTAYSSKKKLLKGIIVDLNLIKDSDLKTKLPL